MKSNLLSHDELPTSCKTIELLSPLTGRCFPLSEVPSLLFQQRLMGEGVAIAMTGSKLISPFNGVVSQLSTMGNHIRLTANNGLQMLIHIGLGSDALMGEGYVRHCQEGQAVGKHDTLLSFNTHKLKATLGEIICPITILNSHKVTGILPYYQQLVAAEDTAMRLYI